MKLRSVSVFSLLFCLALVSVLALALVASAQDSEQAFGPEPVDASPGGGADPEQKGSLPFATLDYAAGNVGQAATTSDIALGEPGLSFRYLETFGVTEQAYIADVQHLNRATGLYIDAGDKIHVVEEWGSRMLKYDTGTGDNLLAIGVAGLQNRAEYSFSHPTDVTTDSGGHIWVVDRHRAVQYDSSGNYMQELPPEDPWNSGDDEIHFDTPGGIAFDSGGRMYVSDSNNHRVQVYTFVSDTPVYSTTIGVTGVPGSDNAHFDWPQRIAFDSSDRLYVADVRNFRILRCTYAAGWTCTPFHGTGSEGDGPDELGWAIGVATDSTENLYIADSGNNRVKKCDSNGSCAIFATGFGWVPDVAVDSDGNVYASDWDDCTIQEYTSSGTPLGAFKGISGVPYLTDGNHPNRPFGLAVDGDGNIYVSTDRGFRVLKLDATGAAQWAVGTPGVYGSDNVHFGDSWFGPDSVAVDAGGNVYVVDTGNHRIQIYDSGGSFLATLGSYGSGEYGFDRPAGVAVDRDGWIYVADTYNHRVQIYDSSRVHVDTLGVTDVCGADSDHFCYPWGVTVDNAGNVYVADADNNRIQVFDSLGVYQRTIGSGGGCDTAFDRFCEPRDVAVDAQGRVYVADMYNERVQVFDGTGAYLTTIGGQWGVNSGQLRQAAAVDVDRQGNVFVADSTNHRIQKYAPGVPGWRQVNINAFGDRRNEQLPSLAVFNGQLYAGTWFEDGDTESTQIWRTADGASWQQVGSGFGNGAAHMISFAGYLYVGTWDGRIWRTPDGLAWTEVVTDGFGHEDNGIARFFVYSNTLYVGTWNGTTGTQIWRTTNGTDWTQFGADGLGDASNGGAISSEVFGGLLYVGIGNWDTGAQLWRTDGASWTQVVTGGFGEAANTAVSSLAAFDGSLYAGLFNEGGVQVWRSPDGVDWEQVVDAGFGNSHTRWENALEVYEGRLYLVARNSMTGLEVWRTADGANWEQVGFAGFGDSNNEGSFWDGATVVFEGNLYIAASNWANGGEVWTMLHQVYLPLVLRSY